MAPVKVGKPLSDKIRTGLNNRNVKSGRWLLATCFWQVLLRNQKIIPYKTLKLLTAIRKSTLTYLITHGQKPATSSQLPAANIDALKRVNYFLTAHWVMKREIRQLSFPQYGSTPLH